MLELSYKEILQAPMSNICIKLIFDFTRFGNIVQNTPRSSAYNKFKTSSLYSSINREMILRSQQPENKIQPKIS